MWVISLQTLSHLSLSLSIKLDKEIEKEGKQQASGKNTCTLIYERKEFTNLIAYKLMNGNGKWDLDGMIYKA